MVTGMLPWTKRKMDELFDQIRLGSFSFPKYVSAECQDLIQKLMTVDPNKRITIEDAKKHDWFFTQNAAMSAIPISLSEEPIKAESFQPNSPIMDKEQSSVHDVPYLSIRKIDEYFRPSVDYDYHRMFKRIKNIYAIENYHKPEKSNASSPQLCFEKAIKELQNSSTVPIKSRRKSYGTENIDPNAMGNDDTKLAKDNNQKICSSQMNFNVANRKRNVNYAINRQNEVYRNPQFSLSIENLQKNPNNFLKNIRRQKSRRRKGSKKIESLNSFD